MSDEITATIVSEMELRKLLSLSENGRAFTHALNLLNPSKHKTKHVCLHEGCNDKSCDSHEISQSIFIKRIESVDKTVLMLSPNFRENSLFYSFGTTHSRNATTFPGYCAKHDKELFASIEDQFVGVDSHFVHKQVLRTLRKEIFSLTTHYSTLRDALRECFTLRGSNSYSHLLIRTLSVYKRLRVYRGLHADLFRQIEQGKELLTYRIQTLSSKKLIFSAMYDITLVNDLSPVLLFTYVLPGSPTLAVLATFSNDASTKVLSEICLDEEHLVLNLNLMMGESRENIVFSREFVEGLSNVDLKLLEENPRFMSRGPLALINFLD